MKNNRGKLLFCILFFRTFAVAIEMQTATAGCGSAKAKRACLRVHLAPQLHRESEMTRTALAGHAHGAEGPSARSRRGESAKQRFASE